MKNKKLSETGKFYFDVFVSFISFAILSIDSGIFFVLFLIGHLFNINILAVLSVLTVAVVAVFLTPVGELYNRKSMSSKPAEDVPDAANAVRIFEDVKAKAAARDPKLKKVRLFVSPGNQVNGFIMGARTVYITQRALNESPEIISGIIAHEFGHLHKRHWIRNQIANAMVAIITAVFNVIYKLDARALNIQTALTAIPIFRIGYNLTAKIYTTEMEMICFLYQSVNENLASVLGSHSHSHELQADEFAVSLGFSEGMINLLENAKIYDIATKEEISTATHPLNDLRIKKIKERTVINNG